MKPENDRCEEHGLYLYRTDFGWSCKLGCYYTDDPQKIKEGYIQQYKEELKDKINARINDYEKIKDIGFRTDKVVFNTSISELKNILKFLEE